MCGKGGHVSSYNGFAASRAAYLDIPVNLDVLAHEILRNLYSKHIYPANKNYTGHIYAVVTMDDMDVFFPGSLGSCSLQIESVTNKLAEKIKNICYDEIEKEEMEQIFIDAMRRKEEDEDVIALSVSDRILFAIKIEQSIQKDDMGKYMANDSVRFYINIPENIKIY